MSSITQQQLPLETQKNILDEISEELFTLDPLFTDQEISNTVTKITRDIQKTQIKNSITTKEVQNLVQSVCDIYSTKYIQERYFHYQELQEIIFSQASIKITTKSTLEEIDSIFNENLTRWVQEKLEILINNNPELQQTGVWNNIQQYLENQLNEKFNQRTSEINDKSSKLVQQTQPLFENSRHIFTTDNDVHQLFTQYVSEAIIKEKDRDKVLTLGSELEKQKKQFSELLKYSPTVQKRFQKIDVELQAITNNAILHSTLINLNELYYSVKENNFDLYNNSRNNFSTTEQIYDAKEAIQNEIENHKEILNEINITVTRVILSKKE